MNSKNFLLNFRALKIGSCSDILEKKENIDCVHQVVLSEKLLKNIDNILKRHVKCNDSGVISKQEVDALKEQLHLIKALQDELNKLPSNQPELRNHLKIIEGIQSNLQHITNSILSSKMKVEDVQSEVVAQAADELYFSI